ncbi:AsnC family protein [Ochrobactrum pseudogrignonense]|uniref:AsnC family protein n=1 Tax=Brucella pseudogrignonensis TaxID=419475 RepID=A0A7Y3WYA9_9HYPH|nr:AsnC family protein [Brucella pseudogrignonensis]NNV22034.1 AsnC family protein [Brucella pseudogrignonensis]
MVGTGNLIWTAELDRELRSLVRKNTPTRTIANLLGVHRIQVIRRIKKLELTADNAGEKVFEAPPHIQSYKTSRRGFYVPPHQEAAYYDLLKSGVSIDEARKRLRIKKQPK